MRVNIYYRKHNSDEIFESICKNTRQFQDEYLRIEGSIGVESLCIDHIEVFTHDHKANGDYMVSILRPYTDDWNDLVEFMFPPEYTYQQAYNHFTDFASKSPMNEADFLDGDFKNCPPDLLHRHLTRAVGEGLLLRGGKRGSHFYVLNENHTFPSIPSDTPRTKD